MHDDTLRFLVRDSEDRIRILEVGDSVHDIRLTDGCRDDLTAFLRRAGVDWESVTVLETPDSRLDRWREDRVAVSWSDPDADEGRAVMEGDILAVRLGDGMVNPVLPGDLDDVLLLPVSRLLRAGETVPIFCGREHALPCARPV